jgi:hypothetical protein
MAESLLCDNDIILKSCCCDLSVEVLICLARFGVIGILGAAQYVVASRISRSTRIANKAVAQTNFEVFISSVQIIEPTENELELAAEFESEAQKFNLSLDGGESILLAALLHRAATLMLTGDKRAITAMETLKARNASAAKIPQQIACLEQMFLSLLQSNDFKMIQERVCCEPATDLVLSNCFSCKSGKFSQQSIQDGLTSYVTALRLVAPSVLLPTVDLSAVIT